MNYTLTVDYLDGRKTVRQYESMEDAKEAYNFIFKDKVLMQAVDAMSVASDEGYHFGHWSPPSWLTEGN